VEVCVGVWSLLVSLMVVAVAMMWSYEHTKRRSGRGHVWMAAVSVSAVVGALSLFWAVFNAPDSLVWIWGCGD